jgi:mRNA-degrading endonuclease toxin of MazEF toxin-antitoxin module
MSIKRRDLIRYLMENCFHLPRKCVVNVIQIKLVDRRSIKEKIGSLSKKRAEEVEKGTKLVLGLP